MVPSSAAAPILAIPWIIEAVGERVELVHGEIHPARDVNDLAWRGLTVRDTRHGEVNAEKAG